MKIELRTSWLMRAAHFAYTGIDKWEPREWTHNARLTVNHEEETITLTVTNGVSVRRMVSPFPAPGVGAYSSDVRESGSAMLSLRVLNVLRKLTGKNRQHRRVVIDSEAETLCLAGVDYSLSVGDGCQLNLIDNYLPKTDAYAGTMGQAHDVWQGFMRVLAAVQDWPLAIPALRIADNKALHLYSRQYPDVAGSYLFEMPVEMHEGTAPETPWLIDPNFVLSFLKSTQVKALSEVYCQVMPKPDIQAMHWFTSDKDVPCTFHMWLMPRVLR